MFPSLLRIFILTSILGMILPACFQKQLTQISPPPPLTPKILSLVTAPLSAASPNTPNNDFITRSFPLSPAFNIVPIPPVAMLELTLKQKLDKSLYSKAKRIRVEDKIAKLLTARQNGSLTTLKARSENIVDTGVLQIYATNFEKSLSEFARMYDISEKSEYLFYIALNSALMDKTRGKIEFTKYIRVARLQGDGELWYNLARMLASILSKESIQEKIKYKAFVKWFYDQYAFYTCFLMLKLYEQYVPLTERDDHDWNFIHTMNVNLLTHSGNPLNAIEYLEKSQQTYQNLSPNLLNKLFILYYKTKDYDKSLTTLDLIPPTYTRLSSHYYYKALLYLSLEEFELFDKTFLQLEALTSDSKHDYFVKKLKEFKSLREALTRFQQQNLSYTPASSSLGE